VNADGSGLTNVSNDPCGAGVLPWSPDGSRIAFSSGPGRGMRSGLYPPPTAGGCIYTIYVVNADGSGRTNLTNGPADFGAWSPDGSRIAFTRGDNGNRDVYVVNADGSGLTNLTNSPGFDDLLAGDRDGPTWSPDSSRVRFTSECRVVGREPDLYEVNADGSGGLTNLGHPGPIFNGGVAGCAGSSLFAFAIAFSDYSPDGSRIAFTSNDNGYKMTDLYVMNADGSGVVTRLTNNPASDGGPDWFPSPNEGPVWSPDGSHIVFTADRDGDGIGEIYVVNADGSGLTNLSNNPGVDGFGAWSPDGSRIFLTSGRVGDGIGGDGNGEIYVVNADGSGLTNLTKNPGNDYGPGWSPAR
jgi:TolB protein